MNKQGKVWDILIKYLGKLFDSWMFFKAFATASTLENYYIRGYWYGFFFLLFIGVVIFLLEHWGLYLGFLTNRGSDLPLQFQEILSTAKEIIGLKSIFPRSVINFPLYLLVPITYLFINFIPKVKLWIGNIFSKFFISLFSKSIDVGEWFINHRWSSIFTILTLTFALSLGLYYIIDNSLSKKQLRKDLTAWFERTETFIETNPFSENEYEGYKNNVQNYWNPDFEKFFVNSEKNNSSFSVLNNLLFKLYGEPKLTKSWFEHLGEIDLTSIKTAQLNKDLTEEEIRAWCLVHILIGRINSRKFERNFRLNVENKTLLENLNFATAEFNAASLMLKSVKNQSDKWVKQYKSSINNGLGITFSNYFKYLVKNKDKPDTFVVENEDFNGCKYPRDCVSKTREYFNKAAEDYDACSYQKKRAGNNITDLFVRVAQNYDFYSASVSLDENKIEMSKLQLSTEIENEILELTQCLKKPYLNPIVLTTISQASISSAKLKIEENIDSTAEVVNSANYLKLAYNFSSPSSFLDWELEPYCNFFNETKRFGTLNQEVKDKYIKYQDVFNNALKRANNGDLESPTPQLKRRILEVCQ